MGLFGSNLVGLQCGYRTSNGKPKKLFIPALFHTTKSRKFGRIWILSETFLYMSLDFEYIPQCYDTLRLDFDISLYVLIRYVCLETLRKVIYPNNTLCKLMS